MKDDKETLRKFISKKSKVLEVGSNVGFFSLYIADKVQSVDMVEMNEKLVCVYKKAKDYLKVSNANIFNMYIKKFKPNKKYDIIFSFAVHKWVGMPLKEYLMLLKNLLDKEGITDDHNRKIRKYYYLKRNDAYRG
jgi:16S rRNA G527 N7-methylase RsmG